MRGLSSKFFIRGLKPPRATFKKEPGIKQKCCITLFLADFPELSVRALFNVGIRLDTSFVTRLLH